MKQSVLFPVKHMLLLLVLPCLLLSACKDECKTTESYTYEEPVFELVEELRQAVKVSPARELAQPGKIYVKDHFIFINELDKGIHIINNSNPASPQKVSFIEIPGNVDLAIKDNILYADSYIDLVVLDISNPLDVHLVNRVENIFPNYGTLLGAGTALYLAGFETKTVTRPSTKDCGTGRNDYYYDRPDGSAGRGGSMARFTITGNHLYTVSLIDMQLFDISKTDNPQKGQKIRLGFDIETIFPYQNKLFIGSSSGMHIYDNSNPAAPAHLSTYAHVNSCDPVVVEDNLAWVTLRSGNDCAGFTNQLEVINISDPRSPKLEKTYPMQNPHGLGIDRKTLFICEGAHGLKVFDTKDYLKVDENLKVHIKNLNAYDVIPLGTILLLIGQDGLYQYDYSNVSDIKLLSKIPVARSF